MNDNKKLDFNTALTALVGVMVTLLGFFAKHSLESIESNQRQLWQSMMPRHEVELQIESIKSNQVRAEAEILEFRGRVSHLEIEVGRLIKTP